MLVGEDQLRLLLEVEFPRVENLSDRSLRITCGVGENAAGSGRNRAVDGQCITVDDLERSEIQVAVDYNFAIAEAALIVRRDNA